MVHNGVEYALMQAYAEGFELMQAKQPEEDPALESLAAYVDDSGEGRWTVTESVELAVPTPAITTALYQRFRSRQEEPFGARLLAALRQQFGGHAVRQPGDTS